MTLSSSEVIHLLFLLGILLLIARGAGELSRALKQPMIIGEIIAGIILGPGILGHVSPELYSWLFAKSPNVSLALDGIIQISLVMLLLIFGLEVDLSTVIKQGRTALMTSIFSFAFPFVIGFVLGYFIPGYLGGRPGSDPLIYALFLGVALSITALPVVARTLLDIGILRSKVGTTIIASAMFIDFIGWLIFSIILGLLGKNIAPFGFTATFIITFSFVLFLLLIGRKLINKLLPVIQERLSFPGGVLNFLLIMGFFSAAFTEYIGIHAIFGAFIIGIAIGDSPHLRESTREIIQQFVTNIFAPLFFISIGLKADFIYSFNPYYVVIFLLLAFVTKIVGTVLGARLGGFKKHDSLIVGFGMNSRGAMEIILGLLALKFHVITDEVFVTLVIMALVTSVTSAPLMNIYIKKSLSFVTLKRLLVPERILISDAMTSEDCIKELSAAAGKILRMPREEIFNQVYEREKELPTGLMNGVAIPHARLVIPQPLLVMAFAPRGIDFSALDGKPSKLVFLLLTPAGENELQLELLASLAKLAEKVNPDAVPADADTSKIFNLASGLL